MRPICDRNERRNRLTWLTTLVASLQKSITGALGVAKCRPNVFDDLLLILHRSLRISIEAALVKRGSYLARSILFCPSWATTPESCGRMLDSEITVSLGIGEQERLILRLVQ
ncbi:MAG TPA: hypothetical protein VK901_20440 [Nitrospiraceae bacterium]|nr:hypothetical protein [Nitrospiraceae bacterium]